MKCLFVLSIIAMIFVTGEAIKCYESVLIDETFDSSKASTKDCISLIDACKLDILKFTNGSSISVRSCISLPNITISNLGTSLPTTANMKVESACQHFCYSDLCNSAQSLTSSIVIIFLTIISFSLTMKNLY